MFPFSLGYATIASSPETSSNLWYARMPGPSPPSPWNTRTSGYVAFAPYVFGTASATVRPWNVSVVTSTCEVAGFPELDPELPLDEEEEEEDEDEDVSPLLVPKGGGALEPPVHAAISAEAHMKKRTRRMCIEP